MKCIGLGFRQYAQIPVPDLRRAGDQGQVGAIVVIHEEHPFAAIAPLGDVMGKTGNHKAGEASHRTLQGTVSLIQTVSYRSR
jgi:hypothetical protein